MNVIILPVMRVTRDLASQLLSIYVESATQNDIHPIASHILATYAPQASADIPNLTSYKDFLQLQGRLHVELQPWLKGLVEAIFDTAVAELTVWGRTQANPYKLEAYLSSSYPMWNASLGDPIVRQFYDLIIEPLITLTSGWWRPQIEAYPHNLWHMNWHGFDAIIQPGEDFRVVEWTRNQQTYGRAGPVATGQVDLNTVAGEESFDAINRYIEQNIPMDRMRDVDKFLGGGVSKDVKRLLTIPDDQVRGQRIPLQGSDSATYQAAYEAESAPIPDHSTEATLRSLHTAALRPRRPVVKVAPRPKPKRTY